MKRRYFVACLFLLSQLYAPAHSLPKIAALIKTAQRFQKPFILAISKLIRSQNARKKQDLISRAWCTLLDTPGFEHTMRSVCKQSEDNVHGHLFELESALKQYERKRKILALNTHIACPQQLTQREFDVVCQDSDGTQLLVECKDISWKSLNTKRKKQLKNQRDIVAAHQRSGIPIKYILHSKRKIPKRWKTWLSNNQIEFEEEEKEENGWETN